MTDPNGGTAGQPLTDEQAEYLRQAAVAQAVSSPSPAGAAAATAGAMTDRGPLLPAEEQIDAMMAALAAQSKQIQALQDQIGVMSRQQAEALAAQGGPLVTRYAKGAVDKIAAHTAANPDVPPGHFAPLAGFADQLFTAAEAMTKGSGAVGDVEKAAAAVERFITRTHVRLSGKNIDWSAVLDDVGTVVDEALKLAA